MSKLDTLVKALTEYFDNDYPMFEGATRRAIRSKLHELLDQPEPPPRRRREIPADAVAVIWRLPRGQKFPVVAVRGSTPGGTPSQFWFEAGRWQAHTGAQIVLKYGEDFEVLS